MIDLEAMKKLYPDSQVNALGSEDLRNIRRMMHELAEWRRVGRYILNGVEDWSTGNVSKNVYITEQCETRVRRLMSEKFCFCEIGAGGKPCVSRKVCDRYLVKEL